MLPWLGGHTTSHVNGVKTLELFDDPSRREGRLGLQLHGAGEVCVMFKDVKIRLTEPNYRAAGP